MLRVPIRMKLALALAAPLLALVVVTVIEVVSASRRAEEMRDQTALASIALGPTGLLSDIEWERNAVGIALLGLQDQFTVEVEDPEAAAVQTDAAIEAFRDEVDSQGDSLVDTYAPAFAAFEELDALRAEVAAVPPEDRTIASIAEVSEIFDRYTELWEAFSAANRQVVAAIDDPQLRQAGLLIDLNNRQTNLVAMLVRDVLKAEVGDGESGFSSSEEIEPVGRRLYQLRQNWEQMVSLGPGVYAPLVEELLAAEEVQQFPQVIATALDSGRIDLTALVRYAANDDPDTLAYTVFAREVEDLAADRAATLRDSAVLRQRVFTALALATVVLAALAIWLVSRSITRPLRSLTRQAKDMAEERLPDAVLDILETPLGDDVRVPEVAPVSVRTRDEVADVAVALNTVQDTALDLAVEQAVLRRNIADSFVNLGRRNQNLLGRQLDFITELETNETDPDTLANLFRLDHLATRMRRNAESLLVLAGIEPPRKWAGPVRLTDVIRAALGEVEDYQRVTVRGVEPATIIGSAAADLAHLLAELIENALVFSPPDQTVDIRGRNRPDSYRSRPDSSDDPARDLYEPGYTLAIIDSGLGMPPNDVTSANRRLAGAESFTIAPSKYLGHYVAGNLAARHNISVHLDNSPGNGITATINLPPTLLTPEGAVVGGPVAPAAATAALSSSPAPPVDPALPAAPADRGTRAPAAPVPAAPAAVGAGGSPDGRRLTDLPPAGPVPASPAGDVRRTPSGLVMRTGRTPAGEDMAPAHSSSDSTIVASLGPYTRGWDDRTRTHVPDGHAGRPTPAGDRRPPPAGAPVPATGLARRVRGAQLPSAGPVSVRRAPARAPYGAEWQQPAADDVYRFLTDFTTGVQRGLDAARRDGVCD